MLRLRWFYGTNDTLDRQPHRLWRPDRLRPQGGDALYARRRLRRDRLCLRRQARHHVLDAGRPRMADPDRRGRLVLRRCFDVRRGESVSRQRRRFCRRRRHDDREERLRTPAVRRSPPVAPVPGGAGQEDLRHQAAGQAALASRSPLADPLLAPLAARGVERPSLSRELSRMRQAGILSYSRTSIILH